MSNIYKLTLITIKRILHYSFFEIIYSTVIEYGITVLMITFDLHSNKDSLKNYNLRQEKKMILKKNTILKLCKGEQKENSLNISMQVINQR